MAEYKLFTNPQFHDAEFYRDRDVSDHINEPWHRQRLLRTLGDVVELLKQSPSATVGDFGCGNGGLLRALLDIVPEAMCFGYDLSPKAVQYANEVNKVKAFCTDFVNQPVVLPNIAILTETLEHLVNPHEFLAKMGQAKDLTVVASVPFTETDARHYEYHLWAWDLKGFRKLFQDAGFTIDKHYIGNVSQHLIGHTE